MPRRARTLLCAALAVAALAPPAQASTYQVNSTLDAVDAAPGDGVCAAANGKCTLRAALAEAGSYVKPADEVLVPAGRYELTLPPVPGDDAPEAAALSACT